MREVVLTSEAPRPLGPYSQAIRAGGFLFVSGQLPIDPATQQVVDGGIAAQTRRVLENVRNILTAAGARLDSVVRCGVFLQDLGDFAGMNTVYGEFFATEPPARSTIEVARLPKDVMVKIEAIALVS
jgi:2-iminobutanoate/2-iminopropanoate deaminase